MTQKKRLEEEFARKSLDRYLSNARPKLDFRITPVDEREQWPDYYLEIAQARIPVEVTCIAQYLVVNGELIQHTHLLAAHRAFVKKVESKAFERGILRGDYHLHAIPVDDFASIEGALVDAIFEYIEYTRDIDFSDERILFKKRSDDIDVYWIQKIGCSPDRIGPGGPPTGFRRGDVAQDELAKLMDVALTKKSLGGHPQSSDTVLILVDDFNFSFQKIWPQAISDLEVAMEFRAVFVASSANGFLRLFPEDDSWLG